jgi:anti-sigma factor RsiW
MSPDRQAHPDDELLEKYALGALADATASALEAHLFVCESCRTRLTAAEKFITGLRGLRHGSDAEPIDETHRTKKGTVILRAWQSQREEWTASLSGGGAELNERFRTAFEANAFLLHRFRELYPDHRCGEQCGTTEAQPPRGRA